MTSLSINAIDLHYGAAQALKAVSIECRPGRITAVLGRNGVGKSSTLRAITGINNISAGDITFGDEVLKKAPPYKRARMGIGHPGNKDIVHSYVLSDFAKSERDWVETMCGAIADNAELLARGEDSSFQNKIHLAMAAKGFDKDAADDAKSAARE